MITRMLELPGEKPPAVTDAPFSLDMNQCCLQEHGQEHKNGGRVDFWRDPTPPFPEERVDLLVDLEVEDVDVSEAVDRGQPLAVGAGQHSGHRRLAEAAVGGGIVVSARHEDVHQLQFFCVNHLPQTRARVNSGS